MRCWEGPVPIPESEPPSPGSIEAVTLVICLALTARRSDPIPGPVLPRLFQGLRVPSSAQGDSWFFVDLIGREKQPPSANRLSCRGARVLVGWGARRSFWIWKDFKIFVFWSSVEDRRRPCFISMALVVNSGWIMPIGFVPVGIEQ